MPFTSVCVYCEQNVAEIMAEQPGVAPAEALKYVLIGGNRVYLCPTCRGERKEMTEAEMWSLLNGPIELPAGTTAIDHTCPMLLYDGFSEEDATARLELEPVEEMPGHLSAHCPECGITVLSKVVQKKDATAE